MMRGSKLATAAVLLAAPASAIIAPAGAMAGSGAKHHGRHHAAKPVHKAGTVSFYARVVRASAHGLVVRTSAGKTLSFSSKQIKHAAPAARRKHGKGRHGRILGHMADLHVSSGNVVVNILGLQPGVLLEITESTDDMGNVTITITLPSASSQEHATGVVSEVDTDAFTVQTGDNSTLRLHMSEDALANLGLQSCETVDVSYHQDAGILIADNVSNTGTSTSGDCVPTQDATGVITQVSANGLTINGDQGPVTFGVDPSSQVTSGFQVGDLVDVTYVQNSDGTFSATDVQFVEQDASGQVTAVTTNAHGGSLTITDDDSGQSETFNADPTNGVHIDAHAFNGVSVGDQIALTYHQSAGMLVADTVTEQ